MTQEEVVKKIAITFKRNNIPYMLTGAIAVNYYGRPRFTHDLDVVTEIQLKDAERITKLFKDKFYVSIEGITDAIEHRTMFNLIHLETGFKIDCWILKVGEYDGVSFSRRKKEIVFDEEIYISSPEDLILTKLDWYKKSGLQKHYNDALGIFEIQAGKLDLKYIRKWASQLSFLATVEQIIKK